MIAPLLEKDLVLTREEYYRWCAMQPRGRFERVDGRIVAMSPERGAHLRVKMAVVNELARAIAACGAPCQALPDGAIVKTGEHDYEPDALVNCGTPIGDDEVAAPNPVVVVEVLSPGTMGVDTGAKLVGYFLVPSVVHYLIVHPTRRSVIHHRRNGERIETTILSGGTLTLEPPGITVGIESFYPVPPAA